MKLTGFLRATKNFFNESRRRYRPLVEILVSRSALIGNLNEYQRRYPKFSLAPVLKSNAYGHGLAPVALILDKQGVAFFVVDSLYEAITLRRQGIKSRILIIGYTHPENIKNNRLKQVAFTIIDLEQLRQLAKTVNAPKEIHLKIDTGMHRQGILLHQIEAAIHLIKSCKFLRLRGICSHFADADNFDESFTRIQIDRWEEINRVFRKNFQALEFFHICASAGVYYSKNTSGNVIRLGLGLYGINPSPLLDLDLRPVLQMQSIISSIKSIPAGEYVGYGVTYKTEKAILAATVPVGYFEGVDRRLSNCGFLKIKNQYCPVIGRVSMNITSLDVSAAPEVQPGDKVTVVSNQKNDLNSVENIAKLCQTIPYEILVHFPPHLRRRVVEE